jgi:hypothetical protein
MGEITMNRYFKALNAFGLMAVITLFSANIVQAAPKLGPEKLPQYYLWPRVEGRAGDITPETLFFIDGDLFEKHEIYGEGIDAVRVVERSNFTAKGSRLNLSKVFYVSPCSALAFLPAPINKHRSIGVVVTREPSSNDYRLLAFDAKMRDTLVGSTGASPRAISLVPGLLKIPDDETIKRILQETPECVK